MKNSKPKSGGKLANRISAFESGAIMERETGTSSADNSNSSLGFTITPTKQSKEKVSRGLISNMSERITAFEEGQCHNSSSNFDFFVSPIAGKDKFVLEQRKGTVVTIVKEFNSVEEANAAALKLMQEKMERRRQYRKGGGMKKKKKASTTSTSSKKEEDKKKYKYKDRKAATVNDTKGVWRNVQATPGLVIDPKTYQPPKYSDKSDEDVALIRKTIEENMLLNANITDQKFKDALVDAFEAVVVQPGEILIPEPKSSKKKKHKSNDSDSYFYIVQQGKVDVKVDGRTVDTVGPGRTFGELNLLYDAMKLQDDNQKATTTTTTGAGKKGGAKSSGPTVMASLAEDSDLETKILRLDQTAYRGIVQNFTKKAELEKQDIIKNNPVLQAMIPKDDALRANVTRNKLTSIMKPVRFEKDGTIKEEETVGDTFFVVQNGHIRVATSNNQMATYGPGDCFGKRALGTITNEPNQVKITGLDNGNVYSIDRKTLDKVLGENHLARTKAKVQDPHKLVRIIPFFWDVTPCTLEINRTRVACEPKGSRQIIIFLSLELSCCFLSNASWKCSCVQTLICFPSRVVFHLFLYLDKITHTT
jgi:CRP-like cAMP-binding protein